MGALVGIMLHAIGGLCAGSFYTPIKKIESWAWESSWLVMGMFAWLIVPLVVASLTVTDLLGDNSRGTYRSHCLDLFLRFCVGRRRAYFQPNHEISRSVSRHDGISW